MWKKIHVELKFQKLDFHHFLFRSAFVFFFFPCSFSGSQTLKCKRRQPMSLRTQAVTPTNSSIRTLKANCGFATTLNLHPFKNKPKSPNPPLEDLEESLPNSFPSHPTPPLQPPLQPPHPIPTSPPLPLPAKGNNLLGIDCCREMMTTMKNMGQHQHKSCL